MAGFPEGNRRIENLDLDISYSSSLNGLEKVVNLERSIGRRDQEQDTRPQRRAIEKWEPVDLAVNTGSQLSNIYCLANHDVSQAKTKAAWTHKSNVRSDQHKDRSPDEYHDLTALLLEPDDPGSPHGDDIFYECIDLLAVEDKQIGTKSCVKAHESSTCSATNFNVVNPGRSLEINCTKKPHRERQDASIPMRLFSALASPRGVRRRIKDFFVEHALEDINRTESLVKEIANGNVTEEELFAGLRETYSVQTTSQATRGKRSLANKDSSAVQEDADNNEEETKESDAEDSLSDSSNDEDVEQIVRGFIAVDLSRTVGKGRKNRRNQKNSKGQLSSKDLDDSQIVDQGKGSLHLVEPLSVSFSKEVILQGVDMTGTPLGSQIGFLKDQNYEAQASSVPAAPNETETKEGECTISETMVKKKKKKKRRMKRLSDAEKIELYEWRVDLVSEKFIERQRRRQLRQERKLHSANLDSFANDEGLHKQQKTLNKSLKSMHDGVPPLRRQRRLLPKIHFSAPDDSLFSENPNAGADELSLGDDDGDLIVYSI